MTQEEIAQMIFEKLNEKIEQLGGEDNLIKAAVWKWWTKHSFSNVQELELALDECEKAHKIIMDYLEVAEFFGGDYEDSFNLPS